MATNDASFSVSGYVATQPKKGLTRSGTKTLTFRIGWTPREVSRQTGEWADLPSSFASVTCFKKIAENAAYCLRKGDPIVLKGTLRVREYADQAGTRRNSVDVVADYLGHDLAKGTSNFSKQSYRAQQTAEEFELSQAADGSRLPGDSAAAQRLEGLQPDVSDLDEYGAAGETGAVLDDVDELVALALADMDGDTDDPRGNDTDGPSDAHGDGRGDTAAAGDPEATGGAAGPADTEATGGPAATEGTGGPADPEGTGEPGDTGGFDQPGEPGESGTTQSRRRYRKAEPVGAGA